MKLIQQNKACVVGSSHMAQSGIKRGATRQIGRWLVSQGREWLNSKLDPTKSQPLSPGEEAALQDSLIRDLTGKGGGSGMTMDEDEFKKFQAFQQHRDASDSTTSRALPCDFHDPAVLETVLEGYYTKYNPDKLEAVKRIAAKWAEAPDKLVDALEEKYPNSRLVHFCPKREGADTAPDPGADSAPVSLSAWAADTSSYTAALTFIVMVCILLATRGIPMKDQPVLAGRVDVIALALIAIGAANLSVERHGANACVLGFGGAQLAWMLARQWYERHGAKKSTIPSNVLRRPRRRDWYNY